MTSVLYMTVTSATKGQTLALVEFLALCPVLREESQQLRSPLGCWLCSPEAGGDLSLAVDVTHLLVPLSVPLSGL